MTFPVTVSNKHAFVFWQAECKKNCGASSFHRCPEGFWTELRHQLWVLCAAESGHWVHLTSDLPTASWRRSLFTEKGKTLFVVPHGSLKLTFQGMLFPPWTKHITLFFPGKNPSKWVITWVGSRPSTHGRPDLQQMPQLGHSPQVRGNMERSWIWDKGLVSLI